VATVLQIPAVALGDNRGTLTRNAGIGKLEMIPGFTAPYTEGRFGEVNKPSRAVGRYDFEASFVDGWEVRH
jgi:hypothetical protein